MEDNSGGVVEYAVRACFVMRDGTVHNLLLKSNRKEKSFLADIIDLKEGQ
jgi:hypothetical protein